ncbi:HET-domain-containing protein [Aaosphaeria arxii CBS 175.79]|uniref:HET-domain-containing protein n=1 Tax=Aaosphaeria arxii CBS 175.79 TaxID=1450172 RepID=A0A6A5XLB9_9PLEO|nr:HET-domain-containing protein [Aaosphaeria arxii CBS 175.79]KAF2013651.1 HET-domain-containing protein [Aaosphaeria arxii CBS 175.79]
MDYSMSTSAWNLEIFRGNLRDGKNNAMLPISITAGITIDPWFLWFDSRPFVAKDSSNQDCLSRVNIWLQNCLKNHEICSETPSEGKLPKRIIDVGDQNTNPRLREFASIDETKDRAYVALSHCWGTFQTYRTEKSSISARMTCMEWTDIPRTFQDAIIVTRSLGIRFIWIDSLAIVQDDLDDWAEESAKMCDIYANATLTIAAAAAQDDTEGFLKVREYTSNVLAVHTNGSELLCYRNDIHRDLSEPGPLIKRAWVFQERLLSPRVLYYEKHEMIWECRNTVQCECGSDLDLSSYRQTHINPGGANEVKNCTSLEVCNLTRPEVADSTTFAWWRTAIVQNYTSLHLTRNTDRLPALSGLAKTILRKTQDAYLAGLWRSDLLNGLLWKANNVGPMFEPSTYIAPSWSWASVRSSVAYNWFDPTVSLMHLNSCSVQPATLDPLGIVKSGGHLTLDCPLIPNFNTQTGFASKLMAGLRPGMPLIRNHKFAGGAELDTFIEEVSFYCPKSPEKTTTVIRSDMSVDQVDLFQVHYLDLAILAANIDDRLKLLRVVGLLLSKSPDDTKCFQRVGIAVIWTRSDLVVNEYHGPGLWERRDQRSREALVMDFFKRFRRDVTII